MAVSEKLLGPASLMDDIAWNARDTLVISPPPSASTPDIIVIDREDDAAESESALAFDREVPHVLWSLLNGLA